jgi:hypothetical protein
LFCSCGLGTYLTGPCSLQVPTNTPAGVGIPWSTSEDQVSPGLLTVGRTQLTKSLFEGRVFISAGMCEHDVLLLGI